MKIIGADAFWETPLMEITLPENVEFLAEYCFSLCTSLHTVRFEGGKVVSATLPFHRIPSLRLLAHRQYIETLENNIDTRWHFEAIIDETSHSVSPKTVYNRGYAPDEIKVLNDGQIFVFNNNATGDSKFNTAVAARRYHGAQSGVAEGLTGNAYSIPTDGTIADIEACVKRFIAFAKANQNLEFLVTKIGCGKAGYTAAQIAPLFAEALPVNNIFLPKEFVDIIMAEDTVIVSQKPTTTQSVMLGSLDIIKGDITTLSVDVIVNAANGSLRAGGGVCGSIHRAAGPELEQECLKVPGRPVPTGGVVMTDAYQLPCKKVIHAVGPVWQDGNNDEAQLLGKCYKDAIALAYQNGYQSIAFPFISSGIFGYPKSQCARVALESIQQTLSNVPIKVILCAFDNDDFDLFVNTRTDLGF